MNIRQLLVATAVSGFIGIGAWARPPVYVVSSRVSQSPSDLWEYDLFKVEDNQRTQLTRLKGPEGEPSWSSAAELVAFVAVKSGRFQVYTMKPDGSQLIQRSKSVVEAGHPSFDPTGERLVYPADEGSGRFVLQVQNLKTQEVSRLLTGPGNAWSPEWAPDGRCIAFVSDRDTGNPKDAHIYVVHVETGTVDRLTDDLTPERDPHFSPDGRFIAYGRRIGPATSEVWILERGSHQRWPVVTKAALNLQPCFTTDGLAILFVSSRTGTFNVWHRNLATGEETCLDKGLHSDQNPRPIGPQ